MLNDPPAATERADASLSVRGLSMWFGDAQVLHSVDLEVPDAQLVALLGPSGCGKTTLLRLVAGLERPVAGSVVVGSTVFAGEGRWVPPERRRIGLVFQDWALFPHLDVRHNVAYGLARTLSRIERAERVGSALEMVGLSSLGDRMPATLSGGQQQRVALARALAPEPSVLLLDEPFSNLDTSLRTQVRTEVHELLVRLQITTVIVTHDQEEAFVLGDEVAVMQAGRIVQQASPAELYRSPASPWVASFVGDANLIPGQGRGAVADTALGVMSLAEHAHGALQVLVRPEDCKLVGGGEATVELVEFYGHDTVYVVRTGDGVRFNVREGSAPLHRRGDEVSIVCVGGPAVAYAGERDEERPEVPVGIDGE